MHHGLSQFEETLVEQAEATRKSQKQQNQGAGQGTDCIFLQCGRDCNSRITKNASEATHMERVLSCRA